ncbi:hypothetical protein QJS26_gp60 [Serratia phage vB_SmaS_Stoker]|uniref:Uncharacterized protein n=1 Tax=Serratia phage vB_SmaS_Stoker TaxID=2902692 RepID=A0AC61TQH5_9CAUD|nr:hypothetical protein QJS26_gp60 [Serratia phage vB_SmaS_Stoker]UGO53812.1 hypothetical protein STOKER_60 [Serratia phage vB_SmaS_Stoker]
MTGGFFLVPPLAPRFAPCYYSVHRGCRKSAHENAIDRGILNVRQPHQIP